MPAPITAVGGHSASFTVPTFGGSFSRNSTPVAAGDSSFLISSPFSIRVIKANLLSAGYTLKAALSIPDPVHTWAIDAVDISTGTPQTVASNEFYGTEMRHTLVVSGPASGSQQALTNAINFQVIAN